MAQAQVRGPANPTASSWYNGPVDSKALTVIIAVNGTELDGLTAQQMEEVERIMSEEAHRAKGNILDRVHTQLR
jgi:hypothetical protein